MTAASFHDSRCVPLLAPKQCQDGLLPSPKTHVTALQFCESFSSVISPSEACHSWGGQVGSQKDVGGIVFTELDLQGDSSVFLSG